MFTNMCYEGYCKGSEAFQLRLVSRHTLFVPQSCHKKTLEAMPVLPIHYHIRGGHCFLRTRLAYAKRTLEKFA